MLITIEYPEAVTNIKDVRLAIEAGDKAGEELEAALDELDKNIAISTAAESGIARREAILGIKPTDTATLEDRRMEVLLKWFDAPIYTETTLRQKLDGAVGADRYRLDIDLDQKLISCRIAMTSKQILRTVRDLFEKVIPLDYAILVLLQIITGFQIQAAVNYHAACVFIAGIAVYEKESIEDAGDVYIADIELNINIIEETRLSATQIYEFALQQSIQVDGRSEVSGGVLEPAEAVLPSVRTRAAVTCKTGYTAELIVRKDFWKLDGAVCLDGSRMLNAEQYVMEL